MFELLLLLHQVDGNFGDVLVQVLGQRPVLLQFFADLFVKRAPVVFEVLGIVACACRCTSLS